MIKINFTEPSSLSCQDSILPFNYRGKFRREAPHPQGMDIRRQTNLNSANFGARGESRTRRFHLLRMATLPICLHAHI